MRKNFNVLLVVAFFVFMVFCFSIANASNNYDRIDGQLHMQNGVLDFIGDASEGLIYLALTYDSIEADTLAGEYVTADTLVADSVNVRIMLADSVIVGFIHGDTLIYEYAELDTVIVDTIRVRAINVTEKITSAISEPTALYTPYSNIYWVDGDGGGDYSTIQGAIDIIDALAFTDSKCIINIAPGTYTENLIFTNYKYIKVNMAGVKIDGTVTFTTTQQSGDYYSKIEFSGGMSNRAEKGDNAEITGNITGTRNNDSLIYLSFTGMELSGSMAFTVDGTWVIFLNHTYFSNSSAFISGDFTDLDSCVLLETMGKSRIKAHIAKPSDGTATSVSLYDVSETEFDLINITPIFDGLIRNCTFTSDITITSNTFEVDNFSYGEIERQTETLAGATFTFMDSYNGGDVTVVGNATVDSLLVSDDLIITEKLGFAAIQSTTLGVGAITFAITTNNITLTGDGGANVLGTITAAEIGIYIIEFVDANITVTDTDAHTADTIDLLGTAIDLTSADDTILMLYYNGVSFLEVSRSVN